LGFGIWDFRAGELAIMRGSEGLTQGARINLILQAFEVMQ